MVRECREELAVTISVGGVFMEVDHDYPDLNVYEFCPADETILKKLRGKSWWNLSIIP